MITLIILMAGILSFKSPVLKSKYIDLSISEFKQMIKDNKHILLDVRTASEISKGKIGQALEIDYKDDRFTEALQTLNKEDTYVVYCRSGRRSALACNIMAEQGFTNLYNLRGGIIAYNKLK